MEENADLGGSIEEKPDENGLKNFQEKPPEALKIKRSAREWFSMFGWRSNPFVFNTDPSLFVGYNEQKGEILSILEEKHRLVLLAGPTGSGKTTLLKWISLNMPRNYDYIFIAKPPASSEELVSVFNSKFKVPWFLRLFIPNIKNPYEIPDFLNKRLKNKHLVILFDEAHEASLDVLEWVRVLSDQVDHITFLLSALPNFEDQLTDKLETLRKRIIKRIEVISLTKEETRQMIEKRILGAGGKDTRPFSQNIIDRIYEETGGFPREVIRLCNNMVERAIREGKETLTADLFEKKEEPKTVSLNLLDKLTPLQKRVVEFLAKGPLTPGEIANMLNLEKYKSRQHAVRSLNNILKMLMQQSLVEREQSERAFKYKLSPLIKTLVVKA